MRMPSGEHVVARTDLGRPWVPEPEPGPWSQLLDRLAEPHELWFGRPESPYLQLGVAGMVSGFVLLVGLTLWTGASIAMAVVLSGAAVATFVAAGLVRTSLARHGAHVLLEDLVLVFVIAATVVWSLGEPVLPYLDLLAPALGAFLVFGRVGCLACGCCHGRPARWGIRYRGADAVPAPLIGVRLFPVQLVEAVWIAAVTSVATALIVARVSPGTTLSFWILAYAAGRFVLEFARGDVARPYLGPLSRAQWIGLGLFAARIAWEDGATGVRTARLAAAGGAALLAVLGYATRRKWLDLPRPLFTATDIPRWEACVAALVNDARRAAGREVVTDTPSSGMTVSLGIDPSDGGTWLYTYTVSRSDAAIKSAEAFTMAGFLAQRLPAHDVVRARICDHGRFHFWVLVHRGEPGSTSADDPHLVLYRAQAFAEAIVRICASQGRADPPAQPAPAAEAPPVAASSSGSYLAAPLPLGYQLSTGLHDDEDQ